MDDPSLHLKLEEQQGFHHSSGQTLGCRRSRSAGCESPSRVPRQTSDKVLSSQLHINDNFAKFSEALYVADRHAREEVRQRTLMQQRLAEKEKANKEEHLRLLAQKAREGRAGGASTSTAAAKPSAPSGAALQNSLGQYGDSDSESRSGSDKSEEEDSGDDGAARLRDKLRREKRQDREREMRMSNMGTEQRMKQLARSVSFHFHSRIG